MVDSFKGIFCIYFEKSVHIFSDKDILSGWKSLYLQLQQIEICTPPQPYNKWSTLTAGQIPYWRYLLLATVGVQAPFCPTELACCDVCGTDAGGNI